MQNQVGISKPVVWRSRDLHHGFPWFSVISVVSGLSANPALNSLFVAVFVVFVISVLFVTGHPHANHRFGKP